MRSTKIKPNGIEEQKEGPTFSKNDNAKFRSAGKTSGKTPSNGVEEQAHGATFTANSTHIPTPNADRPAPPTKILTTKTGRVNIADHDTACDKTASQSGSGAPTDRPYPLKHSYEK